MQLVFNLILLLLISNSQYYECSNGKVIFESRSNLEKIVSTSNELKGVINPESNTFGFSIDLNSFHGFNSQLQKNHYQENYVESHKYPKATFTGKIIEDINYQQEGVYEVRAKGYFEVHGMKLNKIMNAKLTVVNEKLIHISSNFLLNLKEFNIKVPRLVHKKVAENIYVEVDLDLNKK